MESENVAVVRRVHEDGIEVEVNGGSVFTLSGGRIVRLQAYFDAGEARRAFESEAGG